MSPAARKSESTPRTLAFAAGVSLFCALVVSTTVHWLRPIQFAAASLDQARAVLEAARMVAPQALLDDGEIIDRFLALERRVIDLELDTFSDAVDPVSYDYRSQLGETPTEAPRYMQAYVLYENGQLTGMVLPFYGRGMWSPIHGHLALEADLVTVAGISIDEHGETPGIGDRIQAPQWLESWRGKRLYDHGGRFRFRIAGAADAELDGFRVDAITGATITVRGVDRAISQWFGEEGYGPFLARMRSENP